ncbi:maleylpyruvate isomerase family mycothiol-dependent enzyme [Streptomyces sp. MUM 203J]|uniref:maleylpyruvate isomerase family mycothiol-dependent enzyme n=1 Tax=Streptomyces sp. MUM 203J TaxID=2791990 RepID=UPI001F033C77|nr:maleylpyruvate isomerase family mycothiol-dependent enzyme [Streptomyces sp. MUM 203J]MCH0542139.1 maleylpyruvate isomerase family mycothiol-dependent enzyme [Streptomyces sp. MUM 203J]
MAKTRARSYDPGRTRAAVLAQFRNVRDAARTLTPEQLALPTRLGTWTVRDVVAHLGMSLDAVVRLTALPEPAKRTAALVDWPPAIAADAPDIAAHARELAERHPDPDALLAAAEERYTAALAAHPGSRLLATGAGALSLDDYVVTRTVELVVHTDDLNTATGLGIPYDRQALAACTRLLADALAARTPGGAVELRIPPYAVVQCVEGPRHTRGTPPNVVETDPLTWARLATGRTSWGEALDQARLTAGGERADLSAYLPVLG